MTVTVEDYERWLEETFMHKYNISRARAQREYADIIERDLRNPPSWVTIVK